MNRRAVSRSRAQATDLIRVWLQRRTFPRALLRHTDEDRPFVMELVMGVIRHLRTLDWLLNQLVGKPAAPRVRPVLLVGMYQLLFMDDVAEYAAIHETVEIAKSAGGQRVADFTNAVLRRLQREKAIWLKTLSDAPPGIRTSHPDRLIERWTAQFGADDTLRFCDWNNQRPPTVIRIDTARTSMHALGDALTQAGIEAEPHPFDPDRFLISRSSADVTHWPGYAEGHFVVQDPSTATAVDLLAPRPGEIVLDACSAPGGKTLHMASLMKDEGRLWAADKSESRLSTVEENLRRCPYSCVTPIVADPSGRAPGAWTGTAFDAILLDVPCSNTGVIRRKADIRWTFSEARLTHLLALQRSLLEGASRWLKPGGRMVYSTCSLEREENEEQVAGWLSNHPEFGLAQERRLFPPDSQTDGAYAARLNRIE